MIREVYREQLPSLARCADEIIPELATLYDTVTLIGNKF